MSAKSLPQHAALLSCLLFFPSPSSFLFPFNPLPYFLEHTAGAGRGHSKKEGLLGRGQGTLLTQPCRAVVQFLSTDLALSGQIPPASTVAGHTLQPVAYRQGQQPPLLGICLGIEQALCWGLIMGPLLPHTKGPAHKVRS